MRVKVEVHTLTRYAGKKVRALRSWKVRGMMLLGVLCMTIPTLAQDIDLDLDFDDFKRQADAEFWDFRDQCNAEYAQFLAEAWSEFEAIQPITKPHENHRLPQSMLDRMQNPQLRGEIKRAEGAEACTKLKNAMRDVRRYLKKKIVNPLVEPRDPKQKVAQEKVVHEKSNEKVKDKPNDKPKDKGKAQPKVQPKVETVWDPFGTPKADEAPDASPKRSFEFFGTKMEVGMGNLGNKLRLASVEPQKVADAWTLCSKKQYTGLIQDCLELKEHYHLCDWAYLQMLKTMADGVFGKDSNESTFLTAYIFCQSGYRIRLGQSDGRLLLLYASEHVIYDLPMYRMGNINFYVLGQSVRSMATISACDHAINEKEQPLSLLIYEAQTIDQTMSKPRIIQSDVYPEMRMEVSVNENLLRFFDKYPSSSIHDDPMTRWVMYANTPLSEEVKSQIYPGLRKALEGKSEQDKVRMLLSLVQPRWDKETLETSLVYGSDYDMWGDDRAFFAEETLFYPVSDCEDHSILFSHLVRDLVGLQVMLVFYPNPCPAHLATAVRFNQPLEGPYRDRIVLETGEEFYICDPTNYVPEPGVTMEEMDNNLAKVIVL